MLWYHGNRSFKYTRNRNEESELYEICYEFGEFKARPEIKRLIHQAFNGDLRGIKTKIALILSTYFFVLVFYMTINVYIYDENTFTSHCGAGQLFGNKKVSNVA